MSSRILITGTVVLLAGWALVCEVVAQPLSARAASRCWEVLAEVPHTTRPVNLGISVFFTWTLSSRDPVGVPWVELYADGTKQRNRIERDPGYQKLDDDRYPAGTYAFDQDFFWFPAPGRHRITLRFVDRGGRTDCACELSFDVMVVPLNEADQLLHLAYNEDLAARGAADVTLGRFPGRGIEADHWSWWYSRRMDALLASTPEESAELEAMIARTGDAPNLRFIKLERLIREGAPETRSAYFPGWVSANLRIPKAEELASVTPSYRDPKRAAFARRRQELIEERERIVGLLNNDWLGCRLALYRLWLMAQGSAIAGDALGGERAQIGASCREFPVSRRLGELMLDLYSGKEELRWAGWVPPTPPPTPTASPSRP